MVQGQRDPQGQKDIGKTAGGKEYWSDLCNVASGLVGRFKAYFIT